VHGFNVAREISLRESESKRVGISRRPRKEGSTIGIRPPLRESAHFFSGVRGRVAREDSS
jgi:hypothetical protein